MSCVRRWAVPWMPTDCSAMRCATRVGNVSRGGGSVSNTTSSARSSSARSSDRLLPEDRTSSAFLAMSGRRNRSWEVRDSVDSAVLSEVKSGQGRLIDSELDAIESWVAYGREFKQKPVVDANHNGMADDWEQRHGVSDPNGYGLSGDYSNIESYLNDLGQFTAP